MRGLEQLKRRAALERRLRQIDESRDKDTLINDWAGQMVGRHMLIRETFSDIFDITGHTASTPGIMTYTPRIILDRSEGRAGNITACLSTPVGQLTLAGELALDAVDMTFHDGRTLLSCERYRPNRVIDMALRGEGYYMGWLRMTNAITGSYYTGYKNDFRTLEAVMDNAEERQAMIMTALADEVRNPRFAAQASQMMQQV